MGDHEHYHYTVIFKNKECQFLKYRFATKVWPPRPLTCKTLTLRLVSTLLCWFCSLWPIKKRCKIASAGWLKHLNIKPSMVSTAGSKVKNWGEKFTVQALQDQLNRNMRSRFDWWGGCLLLSAVVKCCRSCDDEVIVWSASSLFKRLKPSKAYLPTFVLTLVIADALTGPKMKGLNINCTSCMSFSFCFSTVIPGILLSFYHVITGKTHRKRRPVMNRPALFSTWDKQNVC